MQMALLQLLHHPMGGFELCQTQYDNNKGDMVGLESLTLQWPSRPLL